MDALRIRTFLPFLALLAAGLSSPARGDGSYFGSRRVAQAAGVSEPSQSAVILRDGPEHEVLLLSTTYRGPAAGFAWLIPLPSLPARRDVFLVDTAYLRDLDEDTSPTIFTHVPQHPVSGLTDLLGASFLRAQRSGQGGSRQSALVDRMALGPYDISILSGRVGGIAGWLAAHGYACPPAAAPVIQGYERKGWGFLALRALPKTAREQPVLAGVPPIGIRFATRTLVYPLAISRISAPPVTTLRLIICDEGCVRCPELPTVYLPSSLRGGRGQTYTSLVRRLLKEQNGPALLCEKGDRGSVPVPPVKALAAGHPPEARGADAGGSHWRTATRFWAELPREAMVDLSFLPGGRWPGQAVVRRTGSVPLPFWTVLFSSFWVHLLCYGVFWAALRRLVVPAMRKSAGGRRLTAGEIVAILAPVAAAWALALLSDVLLGVAAAGVVSLAVAAQGRRPAFSVAALTLLVGVPLVDGGCRALVPSSRDALDVQARAEGDLRKALGQFKDATGAYPAQLADLCSRQPPAAGLDSAGNPVPLAGSSQLPILAALPTDPLTRRSDTWVYDPRSPLLVESGGYRVEVTVNPRH